MSTQPQTRFWARRTPAYWATCIAAALIMVTAVVVLVHTRNLFASSLIFFVGSLVARYGGNRPAKPTTRKTR